jgi:farnesyl-diphosphate farnesyltransferase
MMRFRNQSAVHEFTSLPPSDLADIGPNKAWAGDDEFQSDMLQEVSRTFALTIPQLPATLCRVVSNAYLLCRIVDTIEDEPLLEGARKNYFCQQFLRALDGGKNAEQFARQLCASLSKQTPAAEHELIRNTPRVVQITRSFSAAQREALQLCVHTMANGMTQFQLRNDKHGLQTLEDLDLYCYYVAGVVGQLLTSLFCLHSREIARNHRALMPLAVSFGQGLQMTNILKDVWEDYEVGACWLPRQIFAEEGVDLRDLRRAGKREEFQRGVQRLIGIAHGHLKNALTYTLLIPKQEVGIRNFCLWAIGFAVLTLRKINKNLDYTNGNQVKISRLSVKGTVAVSRLTAQHNSLLRTAFYLATTRLPFSPISPDRSSAKTSESKLESSREIGA